MASASVGQRKLIGRKAATLKNPWTFHIDFQIDLWVSQSLGPANLNEFSARQRQIFTGHWTSSLSLESSLPVIVAQEEKAAE